MMTTEMDYYKMSSRELIRELEKRDGELADALELLAKQTPPKQEGVCPA
jgi:hypothetical protein